MLPGNPPTEVPRPHLQIALGAEVEHNDDVVDANRDRACAQLAEGAGPEVCLDLDGAVVGAFVQGVDARAGDGVVQFVKGHDLIVRQPA